MANMIKIETTRFGEIEIAADKVINFPNSIPGFGEIHRYVLLDHDSEGLFKWLQAVDDPDLAFLLTAPNFFKPGYTLPSRAFPISSIGVESPEGVVVMVTVCINSDDHAYFTMNLKGPIVFNHANMSATQYIIDVDSGDYPCDYRVDIGQDSGEETRQASGDK